MTQFQRTVNQVGVKLITANSPEAKGRVKRMNEALQDRLVKEMRLANMSTMKEVNKFLKKYIPKFNKQFAVVPKNQSNLHKSVSKVIKKNLTQIFSIQSKIKLKNKYLNYIVLLKRLNRIKDISITTLTNRKSDYKPSINHPWKQYGNKFNKEKITTI